MSGLYPVKRLWTKAPPMGIGLDAANPLSPDVFCCYVSPGSTHVRELVKGLNPSAQNIFSRPDGFRPVTSGGEGGIQFSTNFTPPNIGSVTFYYRDEGSSGNKYFIRGNADFVFQRNTAAEIECQVDTNFSFTSVPSSLFDGTPHWVTITWRHTGSSETHRLYMDGVEVDSVTSTLFNPIAAATTMYVGRTIGTFLDIEGVMNLAMVHSWNLTVGQIQRLHANAFQVFQPRTLWLPFEQLTAAEQFLYPLRRRWGFKSSDITQVNRTHPSSKGLIGAYLFNEGGGPPRNIAATYGQGTLVSSAVWTTNHQGSAIDCSATGARFDAGDTEQFDFPNNPGFTLLVDFEYPSSPSGGEVVLSKGAFGANQGWYVNAAEGGSGGISIVTANSSSTRVSTWSNVLTTGERNVVVINIWNNAGAWNAQLWVNGVDQGNLTDDHADIIATGGNAQNFRIGEYGTTGGNNDFTGIVNKVLIWKNRWLTDAEARRYSSKSNDYLELFQPRTLWLPFGSTAAPPPASGVLGHLPYYHAHLLQGRPKYV